MAFKTMGFIGGGRVTAFLLTRLKERGVLPEKVVVADPNSAREAILTRIDPQKIRWTSDNTEAAGAEWVFLAVHPPVVIEVAQAIQKVLSPQSVLISFVPTISIEQLSGLLNGFNRIVRMIPNAPSVIGKGYNPVFYSPLLSVEDRKLLESLFVHWGETPEVPEPHLEAYAILTGMGPTYFWFQWLSLVSLGQRFGLEKTDVCRGLAGMLHGAVATLFESKLSEQEVLDLIPAYPLKKDEETLIRIFEERLSSLYEKLRRPSVS